MKTILLLFILATSSVMADLGIPVSHISKPIAVTEQVLMKPAKGPLGLTHTASIKAEPYEVQVTAFTPSGKAHMESFRVTVLYYGEGAIKTRGIDHMMKLYHLAMPTEDEPALKKWLLKKGLQPGKITIGEYQYQYSPNAQTKRAITLRMTQAK